MDAISMNDSTSDVPVGKMRRRYLLVLNWAFAAFNAVRILTYLPNIWAIAQSGDSSQHSLVTWLGWAGANASMAAWLYENSSRRFNKAVALSAGNALMCIATSLVICVYR